MAAKVIFTVSSSFLSIKIRQLNICCIFAAYSLRLGCIGDKMALFYESLVNYSLQGQVTHDCAENKCLLNDLIDSLKSLEELLQSVKERGENSTV